MENTSKFDADDAPSEEDEDLHIEYDIAVYPSDYTLRIISDMWNNDEILLPDFQRGFVWSMKQASQLVESFLIGLPVPPVFFYIDEEYHNLVVDGQQRISSIAYFLSGYFGKETPSGKRNVFRLQGLSENSPYSRKTFDELDSSDKRKLENSVLRAINIRQLSPKHDNSSIFHIFERLNTGGTALKSQEIRNCVYHGPLVEALNKLNGLAGWRDIIGQPNFQKHQRDVEMILRIFSFWERWEDYEKPMKRFLNEQMASYQDGDLSKFYKFGEDFRKAVEIIGRLNNKKPFHIRGPLNLAALDSVFSLIIRNVDRIPENLEERLENLLADELFRNSIQVSTSDNLSVKTRMTIANRVLFES